MHIETGHSPRRPVTLTPLIDVIFLLLLFFMLSSTFLKFARMETTGGQVGEVAAAAAPDVIIRVHADGGLDLNGVELDRASLAEAIAGLHENGARSLAIVPLEGADVQDLVSVLEAARAGPITTINLVR